MATQRFRLSVKNLGPIRSGAFELRPLTVFVGPNNSGKTYMALLTYVVCQTLMGRRPGSRARSALSSALHMENPQWEELNRALGQIAQRPGRPRKQWFLSDISAGLPDTIYPLFDKALSHLRSEFRGALRNYFGTLRLANLRRAEANNYPLVIQVDNPERLVRLEVPAFSTQRRRSIPEPFSFTRNTPPLANLSIPDPRSLAWHPVMWEDSDEVLLVSDEFAPWNFQISLWRDWLSSYGLPRNVHYLPAARSGILQGWTEWTNLALEYVRQEFGRRPIQMSGLRGVAGDFLQVLFSQIYPLRSEEVPSRFLDVIQLLEEAIGGTIAYETTEPKALRQIVYESDGLRLPLERTSSMVAESAPLDLWLKYVIRPNDLLIIDEPEAHLHPGAQLQMGRVLVRLAKAGVKVLCTTHSSQILHQISNALIASRASSNVVAESGLSQEDVITPDDVGVFLFKIDDKSGSEVVELEVDSDFGVPEDEFVKVAEEIGEQTFLLTTGRAQ